MAGFGGSARLALLTGMVTGVNKRDETSRQIERENILNEQVQQMIRESAARVKNYQLTQERQAAADAAAARQEADRVALEARKEADRKGYLDRAAPAIARETGMDVDEVRAMIELDPNIVDDLMRRAPDQLSALDQARTADVTANAEEQRMKNAVTAETQAMLKDYRFAEFRRYVRQRNEEGFNRLVDELRADYPLAVDVWLDENLPDENEPLDSNARQAARTAGESRAAYLLQQANGDPVEAIRTFNDWQAANPPQTQEDQERDNAVIRALQKAFEDSKKDGGTPGSANLGSIRSKSQGR